MTAGLHTRRALHDVAQRHQAARAQRDDRATLGQIEADGEERLMGLGALVAIAIIAAAAGLLFADTITGMQVLADWIRSAR